MTTMLSRTVRAIKQARRFVKLISRDSIINGIHEERLFGKYSVVKFGNFPGATIEDM